MPRKVLILVSVAMALVTASSKVMQIGDSWTEYAQNSLVQYCSGATAINKGISSSTAQQWATAAACPAEEPTRSCSAPTAFSEGSGYTHVVLSVGGNDFLDTPGCSMTQATVTSRVKAAVDAVRAAGPTGLKIILIAYCTPTKAVGDCSLTHFPTLNNGIKNAADGAADVTFIDAHASCGGTTTTWSPGTHHVDNIHLNAKGYCEVWTIPGMQTALGCGAATYDCSSVAATAVAGSEGLASGHADADAGASAEESEATSEGATEEPETGTEEGGMGAGAYAAIAAGAVAALGIMGYAAVKILCKSPPKTSNAGTTSKV